MSTEKNDTRFYDKEVMRYVQASRLRKFVRIYYRMLTIMQERREVSEDGQINPPSIIRNWK